MLRCFALLVAFVSTSLLCAAQTFGGNPSSLKWRQINTDTARIIFPEGLEDAARRVASIVHDLEKSHTASIGKRYRKINIVLQNQTTESNAYVALGPFRSEFYLFPPQNSFELGALPWVDNLSVHEFRHVQQYGNFDVGLSRLARILFGQQGQELANAAAVPNWFFEGDAVFNETSLSRQGRGRLPFFYDGYQALYRDGRQYSYMKLRNGSLKDYVPDHYRLGYMLVGYGRQKYGADFWKQVTHDAAAFRPLVYPFQHAVQRYAGIPYRKFVADAFNFYEDKWKLATATPATNVLPEAKNEVVDYKYPYIDESGGLIVLKSSYRRIPAFYKISNNGEARRLGVRDIANDDYFSYNNGQIVYTSHRADRRWGYRMFSDIKILDVATGHTKKITHKERYFSPDISHSSHKVAVVEMRPNLVSAIVVLDQAGVTIFRSKASRGLVYTYPKFSANDSSLFTCVRNENGDMALKQIDLATGKENTVVPFDNRVIGYPTVQGDTVFFTASYQGSDESWAYIASRKQTFRLAFNPTGFYQTVRTPGTEALVTSNFTSAGYRLVSIAPKDQLWQPVPQKTETLPDLYVPGALQQEDKTTLARIATRNFETRKYSKAFNLLNFHSWRPYYDDPEISVSVLGENVLNTLQTEISYTYNRNETSHRLGIDAIYGGWYIQPLISVGQTWSRDVRLNRDTVLHANQFNAGLGLRLPLDFSAGKQYRSLTLSTTVNNNQVNWQGLAKGLLRNTNFNYFESRLQYAGQIQKAQMQIYPQWAQTLLLQYRGAINNFTARQFLASGSVYLPGLSPTHNFILTAAFQGRDTLQQYYFSSSFPFGRGYNAYDYPRMVRAGINYHFPLWHPDFGLGNMVYFKRIRANTFYDYTWLRRPQTKLNYNLSSAGAELFFDTKWWNQEDVSFGLRYSHLFQSGLTGQQPNQWEIILPVGLFQ